MNPYFFQCQAIDLSFQHFFPNSERHCRYIGIGNNYNELKLFDSSFTQESLPSLR